VQRIYLRVKGGKTKRTFVLEKPPYLNVGECVKMLPDEGVWDVIKVELVLMEGPIARAAVIAEGRIARAAVITEERKASKRKRLS
jgi:hypothetical protein